MISVSPRSKIITAVYKLFPFSLKGDASIDDKNCECDISCIINFYGRIHLLEGILYSLTEQDLSKSKFEVILVEDRGGTSEGRGVCELFKTKLHIRYFALPEKHGFIGYSRNYGISRAKGEYILFLDDDAVILQKNFLSALIDEFKVSGADGIVPFGSASYALLKGRYDFHDPHYPTNRCMAYRRDVMRAMNGFVSEIIGQEDVEFVVRFTASQRRYHYSRILNYFHPPLIVNNLNKAAAVGFSFAKLKSRYPFMVWLMLIVNGLRYLPLLAFPISMKWKMQGKFSLGFLWGLFRSAIGEKASYT